MMSSTQPQTPLSQWRLDIPEAIAQSAWQQSQTSPTARAQWNTYLNQLCLATLLPLLQSDYQPAYTPYPEAIGSLWELVSGTGISGGPKRLVLIPDKNLDRTLSVPQEWVDSPEWAGDYYLAVQVNPDEQWLEVWGYTTHAVVKTQGSYNPTDRTYDLDSDQLIQDLNVLSIVQQSNPHELTQASVATIPSIEPTQADNLLKRIAQSDRPRLEIPFPLWMSCIQQPHWRQQLSDLRRGIETVSPVTHLTQWIQNHFESGWQTIENLLTNELGNASTLDFALRKSSPLETAAIRRAKVLRFSEQLLLLLVSIEPQDSQQMEIRIQIRSGDETSILPLGLILRLQSASGEIIQRVQARDTDLAIQLQRFRCPINTPFVVHLRCNEQTIEEQFMA
jgi:Protein of unknown function (DUF1822)